AAGAASTIARGKARRGVETERRGVSVKNQIHRAVGLAVVLFLSLPGIAGAHVTVQPATAPAKGFVVENVRVPTEGENASTVKVAVQFPPGFAEVSYQAVPGWKVSVKKTKLAQPIKTDEGDTLT